jgi:uroporphyrinogen-III synthase
MGNPTVTTPPRLHGGTVVITRPAGTAAAFARQVRALGGKPLLLPGLALRAAPDPSAARINLDAALRDELLIFTSPAAVHFAARLRPLRTRAEVFAVGQGTAGALRRHGVSAQAPTARQDSDGVLALPALQALAGRCVALVGAAGGRGVLREQLAARGATLREVHVYQRAPPRLDRRHFAALAQLPADACVLWSSAQALQQLQRLLPAAAWSALCGATAVASSERLAQIARAAGFARIRLAASALGADLLAAAATP